jgi:hypothetical protein
VTVCQLDVGKTRTPQLEKANDSGQTVDGGTTPASAGRSYTSAFTCSICGEEAGTVTLVARGQRSELIPDLSQQVAERLGWDYTIAVIAFGRGFSVGINQDRWDQLKRALSSVPPDVEAIHAAHWEWAPFYCPKCRASYCSAHWQVEEVWDEAGWDFSTATCPSQHQRKILEH